MQHKLLSKRISKLACQTKNCVVHVCDLIVIFRGLLFNVIEKSYECLDYTHTPPAPPMSSTQQLTLVTIAELSRTSNYCTLAASMAKLICSVLHEQPTAVQQVIKINMLKDKIGKDR
jgi:hypothetical protein